MLDVDASRDGRWFVTASRDGTAAIIAAAALADDTPTAAATITAAGDLTDAMFDPIDSHLVLTLSRDGGTPDLWQWDEHHTPKPVAYQFDPLPDDQVSLIDMAVNGDGSIVAATGSDGRVHMWDLATGALRPETGTRLGTAGGWVTTVAFDPAHPERLAVASDKDVTVWDVQAGRRITTLPVATGSRWPSAPIRSSQSPLRTASCRSGAPTATRSASGRPMVAAWAVSPSTRKAPCWLSARPRA